MKVEAPTLVPLTHHFLRAGEEMGYRIRDPNSKSVHEEGELTIFNSFLSKSVHIFPSDSFQLGFAPIDFYMKNGARQDAYTCSLKKVRNRANLVIRKYAFVTKIHFHPGSMNHVLGVEYVRHGRTYIAKSKRETILSAGALSTPKILMLSGIGPKEHLAELNVSNKLKSFGKLETLASIMQFLIP